MNITEKFVEGLWEKSQEIPQDVLRQTHKCLLDYLGVTIGGFRFIREKYPKLITATPNKVFFHAFAAHVLELDDGNRHGMIHLGASIISVLLEVAEKEGLKSDDVLKGITMGYETAVRCAKALQPGHKIRGYHVSGTCGTIGSAMAVAFACGYNKEQLKSTLTCAVSSSAGFLEIQEQASELKPFNLGRAALDGLLAANIGRLAIPCPDDILGGKRGFLAVLTNTPKPNILTDFFEEKYHIMDIYQKVHAACRHCHPAIDATLDICKEIDLRPEQVKKIEVHTYKLAVESHNHTQIHGVSSAKLSTPYSVALAIVKGRAGYADYNNKVLNDLSIRNLTRIVSIIEDEKLTQRSAVMRGAHVKIYLKDEKSYEATCCYPKGEPENPLSIEELEEKFRSLAIYGGMTTQECDEVIQEIWKPNINLTRILEIVCKCLN